MKKRIFFTVISLVLIFMLLNTPYYKRFHRKNRYVEFPFMSVIKEDGTLLLSGANHTGQLGNGTRNDVESFIDVLDNVVSVENGFFTTYAIKEDGTLWAWGSNDEGQVGNGSKDDFILTPTKVLDDVRVVESTLETAYAIKNDDTLWAWGDNTYGAVGKGLEANERTPVKVLDDVKIVKNFGNNTYVIKNDDTLWGWGFNMYGQVGTGNDKHILRPRKILNDVQDVTFNDESVLALKNDGSLWSWGIPVIYSNESKNTNKPQKIMDDVLKVEMGRFTTIILKSDNTLWSIGLGYNGRNREDYEKNEAIKILNDIEDFDISTFNEETLVIKKDGSLWGFGENTYGQIGVGSVDPVPLPTKIMENVTFANSDYNTTYVIQKDGSLWTCGYGATTDKKTELTKILENVEYVHPGAWQSVAVTSDGSLWLLEQEGGPQKLTDGVSTVDKTVIKSTEPKDMIRLEDSGYSFKFFTFKHLIGWILLIVLINNWYKYYKEFKMQKKIESRRKQKS